MSGRSSNEEGNGSLCLRSGRVAPAVFADAGAGSSGCACSPRDPGERPARGGRAEWPGARGHHGSELSRGFERSARRVSGNGPCPGAYDVSRQPGAVGRATGEHHRLDGRQLQRRHAADRDPVFPYRAQGRPRHCTERGSNSHARPSRLGRTVGTGARGDRAGGGPGPFESRVCFFHEASRGPVQQYALCPRCPGYASLVRQNDWCNAQGIPCLMVRAEQCHSHYRRRCGPCRDAG